MKNFLLRNVRTVQEMIFSYSYIQDIGKTYNRNVLLQRNATGSQWVGKISKSLQEKGVDFRDLNERALLAYRLAQCVRHGVVAPKIVSEKRISGLDVAAIPTKIDDRVCLTPFTGIALPEFLQCGQLHEIKNREAIFDNVVFNVWIGNYDRKDGDYVVSGDKKVHFIDYHLYGPGFTSDTLLSIGAY